MKVDGERTRGESERESERERDRESEKERERDGEREREIEREEDRGRERERENVILKLTKNYFAFAKQKTAIFETRKSQRQLFRSLRGSSFRNCV